MYKIIFFNFLLATFKTAKIFQVLLLFGSIVLLTFDYSLFSIVEFTDREIL